MLSGSDSSTPIPAYLKPLTLVDPKTGNQVLPPPWYRGPHGSFRAALSAGGRLSLIPEILPVDREFVVRGLLDDCRGPRATIAFEDPTPYASLEDAAWRVVRLAVDWVLIDGTPAHLFCLLPEDEDQSLAPAATILGTNYPTLVTWLRGESTIPEYVRHHFLSLIGIQYDPIRYGWIVRS